MPLFAENRDHNIDPRSQAEKRPRLFEDAEQLIRSIPVSVLEKNRRKIKSGFKLFRLANESKLKKDAAEPENEEKRISRLWNQVCATVVHTVYATDPTFFSSSR
jgi:hypothetical protein